VTEAVDLDGLRAQRRRTTGAHRSHPRPSAGARARRPTLRRAEKQWGRRPRLLRSPNRRFISTSVQKP
jgi:hypothetical protein